MPGGRSDVKSTSPVEQVMQAPEAGVETVLVLGRAFLVIKKIGDGANSIVYHAINSYVEDMPREVAVKRAYFDSDKTTAAHEEIDLLQRLSDKNIVQCYACEVVRIEGKLSVSAVMEYCGSSLVRHMQDVQQLQRGSSLPEGMIVRIACCIASALSYLHAQSPPIAHRDVKPENVLRAEAAVPPYGVGSTCSDVFKLCDFGSATTVAYHSSQKQDILKALDEIDGKTTIGYRAPEMVDPWTGQRIDERVDVWAFGVLIYYTLFFRLPFGETVLGVINGRLDFPRDGAASSSSGDGGKVRDGLKRLVCTCLVRSADKRPSIFEVIQSMRSDADLGPAGAADFPFAFTSKPPGWTPQPVMGSSSSSSGSSGGIPLAETRENQPKPGGGNLFSQLNWAEPPPPPPPASSAMQVAGGSQPARVSASSQVPTVAQASTSLFDELDMAMFSQAQGGRQQQQQLAQNVSQQVQQPPLADLFGDLAFTSHGRDQSTASGPTTAAVDPLAAFFSSPSRQ